MTILEKAEHIVLNENNYTDTKLLECATNICNDKLFGFKSSLEDIKVIESFEIDSEQDFYLSVFGIDITN